MKRLQNETGQGLLQNKPYMSLMASQLIANLGEWIYILALLTLVGMKWNASPLEITATTLCMVIPMLIGGPLSGMLADRMERKTIMIVSDAARVLIMLLLVFASSLLHVYVLLLFKGIFDVMFSPAKNGKLKELVPHHQLEQAVSISAIIEQGSKVIGPAIGGLLTAAFGITASFYIDAGAFAISALILLFIPRRSTSAATAVAVGAPEDESVKEKSRFKEEFIAGIRIILSIPIIKYGLLTLCMVILVLQIADSQIVVLFRGLPEMTEDMLGWCIAMSGIGTLVAAFLIRFLSRLSTLAKMGLGGSILGFVFAGAGFLALYGTSGSFTQALYVIGFFIAGLGGGLTLIPFQVMIQQRTPERFIGRVTGTIGSLTSVAAIIGPLTGGLLVTALGPEIAYVLSGSGMALIGLALLAFKRRILAQDNAAVPAATTRTEVSA
ncbi:MFS transporter [Paenibacillus sp. NPDC058071]|uniref:MFS transporter n=1 Tax=Paenibacillus sp. NPDC058071 TaxID=3346326 RepID=UPI0036D9DCF0